MGWVSRGMYLSIGTYLLATYHKDMGLGSTSVAYQLIVKFQQIPSLACIDFICLIPNIIQKTLF